MTEGVSREMARKEERAGQAPGCPSSPRRRQPSLVPTPTPRLHQVISSGHTLAAAGPARVQADEGQSSSTHKENTRSIVHRDILSTEDKELMIF